MKSYRENCDNCELRKNHNSFFEHSRNRITIYYLEGLNFAIAKIMFHRFSYEFFKNPRKILAILVGYFPFWIKIHNLCNFSRLRVSQFRYNHNLVSSQFYNPAFNFFPAQTKTQTQTFIFFPTQTKTQTQTFNIFLAQTKTQTQTP